MSLSANITGGNRHQGPFPIEGRLLEGHTNAVRVASVGAAESLTIASARYQKIDCTAAYVLTLPAEELCPGLAFEITNDGSATQDITVKNDAGATIQIISDGETYTLVCDGTDWVSTAGTTTPSSDFAGAVTGTDELVNADLTINHASQVGVAVDATIAQVTTPRTSGYAAAFRGSVTSLTGDTAGVDYYTFYALAPTVGEANADHIAFKVGAGYDVFMDLTSISTGEGVLALKDNLADALNIKEGSNSYLKIVTTNDVERVTLGKVLSFAAPTVVDMADAAHALVYGTAGAGETKLTSNILLVDPNSTGASEILTLPAVAASGGVELTIINTGGEGIVVKDVAANTIITLDTVQHGKVVCDGTNWYGFMGGVT